MPSLTKTLGLITAGLAALTSALPAVPKLTGNQLNIHSFMKRQNALAAAAGLTDVDILQLYVLLFSSYTSFTAANPSAFQRSHSRAPRRGLLP